MNVGLIGHNNTAKPLQLGVGNEPTNFNLKKLHLDEASSEKIAREMYPQAEIVEDTQSIIQDQTIDLVVFSIPHGEGLNLVAQALKAGKNVRVL